MGILAVMGAWRRASRRGVIAQGKRRDGPETRVGQIHAAQKENPAGLRPHGEIRQSREGNGLACKNVGQQVLADEILLVR
jgi:hypothetical protein